MRITAIGNTYQNHPITKTRKNAGVTKPQDTPAEKHIETSIYSKGFSNVSFGINAIQDYIYEKSITKHRHIIDEVDPRVVENYFRSLGIPCSINKGHTKKDNQVIAYCCFNAAEIMRQLNLPLPAKIDMEHFPGTTLAACYYGPDYQRAFPIGTVTFNIDQDWAHALEKSLEEHKAKNTFHTSNHFLHTAIHEFGHNVHYHKLFSKFGSPVPDSKFFCNPATINIMEKLNTPISHNGIPVKNPYISTKVRNTLTETSGYGSTRLPELFAEEFAKAIINDMDFMTLRLERNPFPIRNLSPELYQVLYETWEGLIDDGKGLI